MLDRRFPRVAYARLGPLGLRAKRWSYAVVASPLAFCGVVLVDVTYVAQASIWVIDRGRGEVRSRTWMTLPRVGVRVPERPIREDAVFRSVGAGAAIRHHGAACPREVRAEARVDGRRIEAFASVQTDAVRVEPIQYAERTPVGWQFTQKAVGVPVEGFVRIGSRTLSLAGGILLADYSSGLMPRRVAWWWAAGAGRSMDGGFVAFNLVSGFNDAQGGENTVWVDGRPAPVGRVEFDADERDRARPWRIRSRDGGVDLTFGVERIRTETTDLGIARSRYVQPVGTFTGSVRHGGSVVEIAEALGATERHEALW